MKKLISVFMVMLTIFFMVLPVSAVEEDYEGLDEGENLTLNLPDEDADLYSHEYSCNDPLLNWDLSNPGVDIDDPIEADVDSGISTFNLNVQNESIDVTYELEGLTKEQLDADADGSDFQNIVNVEGAESKNRPYLLPLVREKYSDYPYKGNLYMNMQGSCNDGEYVYYAFFVGDNHSDGRDPVGTCILAGKFDENDTFVTEKITYSTDIVVADSSDNLNLASDLMHANDITYNSLRDELIVVCCQSGYHNRIYRIDAAYFRGETDVIPKAEMINLSCMISCLSYNERRNQYVGGIFGDNDQFAIFDSDFNLLDSPNDVKTNKRYMNFSRAGLCCDDNYIYVTYYIDETGRVGIGDEPTTICNIVGIYDWKGEIKREIYLDIDRVFMYTDSSEEKDVWNFYEIEGITILHDKILLGFNCYYGKNNGARKARFYQCDLSDLFFNVKYCPDDNIAQHLTATDLKSNNVFHGLSTKTLQNTYTKSNSKFVGWNVYSVHSNKWRYFNEETNSWKWCVEGTEPEGYKKAVYAELAKVSQTVGAGKQVLFCAVWETTDKFYVSFNANLGKLNGDGEVDDMSVTHGISSTLNNNEFTKYVSSYEDENGETVYEGKRTFQGWNAYAVEKGKWYYKNLDTGEKGWYIEGEQPDGYTKYVYSDQATVKQTVSAGRHVIFFALWNEFFIYYDSNGELVRRDMLKLPTVALDGTKTYINMFSPDDISDDYTAVAGRAKPVSLAGYYQYRIEKGLWRYADENNENRFWAESSEQPLYYFTNPYVTNFKHGEHLLFKAKWNY